MNLSGFKWCEWHVRLCFGPWHLPAARSAALRNGHVQSSQRHGGRFQPFYGFFGWVFHGFRMGFGAPHRDVRLTALLQSFLGTEKSLSSRSNGLELAPFWEEKPRKSLGAVGARHLSHGAEAATTRVVPVPRRSNCIGSKRGAGRHAQQRCQSF